jgi:hypothetical protein
MAIGQGRRLDVEDAAHEQQRKKIERECALYEKETQRAPEPSRTSALLPVALPMFCLA